MFQLITMGYGSPFQSDIAPRTNRCLSLSSLANREMKDKECVRSDCPERGLNMSFFFRNMYFSISYSIQHEGQSWSWSYSSWMYNYLCNQYLSPLTLWFRIRLS